MRLDAVIFDLYGTLLICGATAIPKVTRRRISACQGAQRMDRENPLSTISNLRDLPALIEET